MLRLFPPKRWNDNSLGNGSCAFNAFGSRLFHDGLLDTIEQTLINSNSDPDAAFETFIELVGEAAGLPEENRTWANVREYLTTLQATDPFQLQVFLTPVLRKLIEIEALKDETHLNRSFENLAASYKNFVDSKLGLAARNRVEDDIYSDHPFIHKVFNDTFQDHGQYDRYIFLMRKDRNRTQEENVELLDLDDVLFAEEQNNIAEWWRRTGYREFLKNMADGRLHKWAGDFELYLLAKYFHVNLKVIIRGVPYDIYLNYGSIPKNEAAVLTAALDQLVARDIIVNPAPQDDSYHFLQITHEQLLQRLSKLPHYDQVIAYIDQAQRSRGNLKGYPVPTDWPAECIEQLRARDIITSHNKGPYVFNVPEPVAKVRMREIPNKEEIAALCRNHLAYYGTMSIIHENRHYNYQPPEAMVENRVDEHVDEVAEVADNELNKLLKVDPDNHNVREVTELLLKHDQIVPNQKKWNHVINQALDDISLDQKSSGEWIKYSFLDAQKEGMHVHGKRSGYISRAEQIEMDAEFAKVLQKKFR